MYTLHNEEGTESSNLLETKMVLIPLRDGIKNFVMENIEQAILQALMAYLSYTILHPINNETVRLLGSCILCYFTMHHNAERQEFKTKRIRFLYHPGLLYFENDFVGIYVSKRIFRIHIQGGKITMVPQRDTPPIWCKCYSFNEFNVFR